jgi:Macrocin-O-methyltransferase (TylF)
MILNMEKDEKLAKDKGERKFDGRANFTADDLVENMIDDHFEKYNITKREICSNFQIYTRRIFLKKFLAHYEFFRKTVDLPGDIVELGIYRGASLMSWANFLEIRNMGDRQKQVIGFDNFSGFTSIDEKDGKPDESVGKKLDGFDGGAFESILKDAIAIFDQDRFIPYKPRVVLIKGNIEETVPQFVIDKPGLRISLLHFDCDMYLPTKVALETFWPRVVPGGIVLFDEYGIRPWEGESKAVDEFFSGNNVRIRRFDWAPNPGGFIIKETM